MQAWLTLQAGWDHSWDGQLVSVLRVSSSDHTTVSELVSVNNQQSVNFYSKTNSNIDVVNLLG